MMDECKDHSVDEVDTEDVAIAVGGDVIAKARSAFQFFSQANQAVLRQEVTNDGKESFSLGQLQSYVSAKWKSLSSDEKKIYEIQAAEDKKRFEREMAQRDELKRKELEEKLLKNSIVETETRMRGTTIASTREAESAHTTTQKRELSESEKQARDERRAAKVMEQSIITSQHTANKETRAQQAEARLKYLLSQSDIFSHFGAKKKDIKRGTPSSATSSSDSPSHPSTLVRNESSSSSLADQETSHVRKRGRPAKKRSSNNLAADADMDDDEKAMAAAVGNNSDDEGEGNSVNTTVLMSQPKCIKGGEMRPYQLEGLNWMVRLVENGINGILADEMGLGKTLQSISVLGYMQEFKKVNGPHLIMVPKSTLSNWMNELSRWCPSLRAARYHGTKEERDAFVKNVLKPAKLHSEREWDVLVTTYEVVNLERSALCKIAWCYLIIDEAHRLKNEVSQFSQTVRMLDTQYRLLLTGTPLQNNLHELWALLNFLLPDVFASSEQFDEWFNLDVDDTESKQRIIGQLHKILRPFMLRRLKADVETSLPPKTETILFTGLSEVQKNLYKQILMREIDTVNGNNGSRTAILNIVMQLRKCCNHPYLFPGVEDRSLDPHGDHLFLNCGKLALLDKLLRKLYERGHRVLIFSQMTRMLDILEDYLLSKSYNYCRIDGNTSYDEREDSIQSYNEPGSNKFIFLLSTRAGGLGINLQTADTVIIYDSDWNPQADLQAQDRAHRIGQKKPVQVYRLVTDDTVEVKVVERAQQKLKLDAMVVQQGRLQDKEKKISKNELLESIRFGADKIFRAKNSTVSDADIDLILEEGKKRTQEMNDKLQVAEKGDLYDFSLDGGMKAQMFEGQDYSRKAIAAREAADASVFSSSFAFIDTGKRERKTIVPTAPRAEKKGSGGPGRRKGEVKIHDFQFFDRKRLDKISEEEALLQKRKSEHMATIKELKALDKASRMKAKVNSNDDEQSIEDGNDIGADDIAGDGEGQGKASMPSTEGLLAPSPALSEYAIKANALLSEIESGCFDLPLNLVEERKKLMQDGFADFSRRDFKVFTEVLEKYGKSNRRALHDEVAQLTGKSPEYIETYSNVFFSRVKEITETTKVTSLLEKIERGDSRVLREKMIKEALDLKVSRITEGTFTLTYGSQKGHSFSEEEDMFLIFMLQKYGYGSWDLIRLEINRSPQFRFDFFFKSRNAMDLQRRADTLIRIIEKENSTNMKKKRESSGEKESAADIEDDETASEDETTTSRKDDKQPKKKKKT